LLVELVSRVSAGGSGARATPSDDRRRAISRARLWCDLAKASRRTGTGCSPWRVTRGATSRGL